MKALNQDEEDLVWTLYHLRYLGTDQIHSGWYSTRKFANCQSRLSRLGRDGVLERVSVQHERWRYAWRLGRQGFKMLYEKGRGSDFYRSLSPLYLPHLLETNELYFVLRAPGVSWGELPFLWQGSHRVRIPFVDRVLGHLGDGASPRDRMLRPDALVTPCDRSLPVTLIELDRGTESIASTMGRRTIAGKFEAYERCLRGRAPGGESWMERALGHRRQVQLLFVVPSVAGQSRRCESILKEAVKRPHLKELMRLACVQLSDIGAVRAFVKVPVPGVSAGSSQGSGAGNVAMPAAARDLSVNFEELREFYSVSVEAYRRLHPESRVRARFLRAAARVGGVLSDHQVRLTGRSAS